MDYFYKDYMKCKLPNNWCFEEEEETLILYNPKDRGAVTVSFIEILDRHDTVEECIRSMAKDFVDQNGITLQKPFMIYSTKEKKIVLSGVGKTSDGEFIKLWMIAKYPKIVFATYFCDKKSLELYTCDKIMDSMEFTF